MNIAIVTVYDSIVNFGSFLQAYAMKVALEELGHQVYFVRRMNDKDIVARFDKIAKQNYNSKQIAPWDILRKIKRKLKEVKAHKLNQIRFQYSVDDWKQFEIIGSDELEKYNIDCVLCGSDEIWNVHNKDVDIQFYTCRWVKSIPLIAYAISVGQSGADQLNEEPQKNILRFSRCLPRDENTLSVLSELGANVGPIVCDPTILLGRNGFSTNGSVESLPDRYMLVYSYAYTKQQRMLLRQYANKHKLKIVSASIPADFADVTIYTSALNFPAIVENAECMFTATFHGTIFGLMYAKKLCFVPRLGKIKSLMLSCSAQEHALNEEFNYSALEKVLSKDVDHSFIDEKMELLQADSLESLKIMLKGIRK